MLFWETGEFGCFWVVEGFVAELYGIELDVGVLCECENSVKSRNAFFFGIGKAGIVPSLREASTPFLLGACDA